MDSDKYPSTSERRRFVKGVVGGATLAGVGAVGTATVESATAPSGRGGGLTRYLGIVNTAGPAPRGMPLIPVSVDGDGFLKGVWPEEQTVTRQGQEVTIAETEVAGLTYSNRWYQYCGVQTYPGIQIGADQDNFFRYSSSSYDWQDEAVSPGDKMHVDDFSDYESWGNDIGSAGIGKPAIGEWRSQDVEQGKIPIQVIRVPSPKFDEMVQQSDNPDFVDWATDQNFVAWLNKCTHFCCVPGFKTTSQAYQFNAENDVYCPCHQSVYDPYSITQKSFTALPRPEEG